MEDDAPTGSSVEVMEALAFAGRDEDDGFEDSSMLFPALDADFEDDMLVFLHDVSTLMVLTSICPGFGWSLTV